MFPEIKDAWNTRDASLSGKRKESQPSSGLGKRQKASAWQGFQEHGRGYQGQGQNGAFG